MNLELAGRLFRGARFLPRAEGVVVAAALAALPTLADGLPGLRASADGRSPPQVPVACGGLLAGPTERALRGALDEALADLRAVSAEEETRKLASDPLVALLQRLLSEGGAVSPGAMVTVALAYARTTAGLFAAPSALVAEQVRQVQALLPAPRGVALARVARLMQSRLVLAILEAARAGCPPPALLGSVANSALSFVCPPAAFSTGLDLGLVHAVTGGTASPEQVAAASSAFRQATGAALGRIAARKGTADDQSLVLRLCAPQLLDEGIPAAVEALVADPDAWAVVLPGLGRFTDAKRLVAAGLSAEQAKGLLRGDVGIAVAASLRASLGALRAWDVITCLAGALVPVADDDAVDRRLTVPRANPVDATVVAVGLAGLRAHGDGAALPAAVTTAWESWTANLGGAARVDLGVVGLVVFATPSQAARFAANVLERSTGGLSLPPVSVATGRVTGGTDGERVRLGGPAVAEALRLLPVRALSSRPEGIHAAARVAVVGGQLAGAGVVIDAATAEGLRRSGLPRHPSKRRPRGLTVREAWDSDEGLLLLVEIPGLDGGLELLRMSPADWAALLEAPGPELPKVEGSVPPIRERSRSRRGYGGRSRGVDDFGDPMVYDGESDDAPSDSGPSRPSGGSQPSAERTVATPSAASRTAPPVSGSAVSSPTPTAPSLPTPDLGASSAGLTSVLASRQVTLPPAPLPAGFSAAPPAPSPQFPEQLATPLLAGDPFAADPFAGAPGTAPASALSAGDDPFADIFGVPASGGEGEELAVTPPATPTSSAPMLPEGGFSMEVEEDDLDDPSALERSDGRSVVDEPLGFSLPVAETTSEVPREEPRKAPLPAVNFGHVFGGYACYVEHDRVFFGRPYGTRLIDHHSYDLGSDLGRAYESFLRDKIREGFIPQTEMVGELPRGVTVMPLDSERLAAAWRALT